MLFFFAAGFLEAGTAVVDFLEAVATVATGATIDFLEAATGFLDTGGASSSSSSLPPSASGDSLDSPPSSSDKSNADKLIGFLPGVTEAALGITTEAFAAAG